MDVTIEFSGNATMNKIMGATVVHKDDEFPIFNVTI
jgi:hypothetical protein